VSYTYDSLNPADCSRRFSWKSCPYRMRFEVFSVLKLWVVALELCHWLV